MSKKIVAIGGGDNGRLRTDGTRANYETFIIDEEITKLSNKINPNYLFIGHAQVLENQQGYYQTMKDIFKEKFKCECKILTSDKLNDLDYVNELIDWADIIYEGGGSTLNLINLWKDSGFDAILKKAWEDGKILCGLSAGANCWFKECASDSLRSQYGPDQPLITMDCLGIVDGLFVPHIDEDGKYEDVRELLKNSDQVGILLSNCCAIEIIDDMYRLILGDGTNRSFRPYAIKAYWENGEYFEEKIDDSLEFKPLDDLLAKNINKKKIL